MRNAGDQPCPRPSLHLLAGTWLVLRTQPGSPTLQLSSTGCGVHLRGDWGHTGGWAPFLVRERHSARVSSPCLRWKVGRSPRRAGEEKAAVS